MDLRALADIAAPRGFAVARLLDLEAHEAQARARGIALERLAGPEPAWRVVVDLLGVRRDLALRVIGRGEGGLRLALSAAGIEGTVVIDVAPAGLERARLAVAVALGARSFGARLAMGPLRLAHPELERRLRLGAEAWAARTATAWAAQGAGGPAP